MNTLRILTVLVLLATSIYAQLPQSDETASLSREVVKLYSEGKFKEALPLAEKAVRMSESAFGVKDLRTGEALRNLGLVRYRLGDNKEAENIFEKAIAVYEASSSLSNASRNELGQIFELSGFIKFESKKYEKAIEFYQKAFEELTKVYGREALETANPLWSLANIYQIKKDYQNAEKFYRQVLEIRINKKEIGSWEIQDAKNRYQCASARNGNFEEAQSFIKSLESQKKATSTPKIVMGGIVNGRATYLAKPEYPAEVRNMRSSGAVTVQITINETGKVIFACAVKGNKMLYEVSERAAYQSTFEPTRIEGQAVKIIGALIYNFSF